VAPERFTLRLAAAPDAFEHLGPAARGAIALIASKEMKTLDDLFAEYVKSGPMIAAARKAGVAALLLQSTRPHDLLYRHPLVNANEPLARTSRSARATGRTVRFACVCI
jgi:hypothetical protein